MDGSRFVIVIGDADVRGAAAVARTGVGRQLVAAALERARPVGHARLVLSTQETMAAAQSVYSRMGFMRLPDRDWQRGDRHFLAFGRDLRSMHDDGPSPG